MESFPFDTVSDPLAHFCRVFDEVVATEPFDAHAVALATVDEAGRPQVRMVLLRGQDPQGLVFHTNRLSRKGRDLFINAHAALCFHWPKRAEQVRVEGTVEQLEDEASDAYFATRPRGHQVGAWASLQSEPLSSREELARRFDETEARFREQPVPRPPHWGGYRIVPSRFEFWKGEESRLHRRVEYVRANGLWTANLLFP
jgi:pyridoxamine 5'-phosphate oxidase